MFEESRPKKLVDIICDDLARSNVYPQVFGPAGTWLIFSAYQAFCSKNKIIWYQKWKLGCAKWKNQTSLAFKIGWRLFTNWWLLFIFKPTFVQVHYRPIWKETIWTDILYTYVGIADSILQCASVIGLGRIGTSMKLCRPPLYLTFLAEMWWAPRGES